MAGYDPAAANEYNQLIQQGLDPDEAAAMAGISLEDIGNYSVVNGQLTQNEGPPIGDTPVNPASDPSQFPAYDDEGNLQPGFAINDETGQPYYSGVIPTRDQPVNPASDPSQFPAYDDEGNLQPGFAVNNETGETYYRGFEVTRDQPVNPASDPSQFPAYDDEGNLQPGFAINEETGQTYYRGFPYQDATNRPVSSGLDPWYSGFETAGLTSPDTSNAANVNDPYYGLTPKQIQDLGGADPTDPYIRARLGIPQLPGSTLAATPGLGTIKTGVPLIDNALNFLGGLFKPTPTPPKTDQPVNPASDPSQFPAYDDEGNLQPGFAINEETGQPYYKGLGPATEKTPVNPASDPSQFPAYDDEGNLQPGFAINDETGQPYYSGVIPTRDQPVNPASDPSQFPAYDDEGNLQPGFAINDETGQTYYQGFEVTRDQPVNPASDPSQFPAYDDEGNLQPGFAINDETGETYYQGIGPATGSDVTTLSDEETAALFEGTDTPTAAQQAATNEQTATDAAALYPGTNNTNLRNINEASAAIAANEAGIANAQDIIARNNAELADPDISDARRAELEANNAAQENYIRLAESNTGENELVIEANADAFAAGGGEPDSGQGPAEVNTEADPELLGGPEEDTAISVTEAEIVPLTDEESAALFEEEQASIVEVTEAETVPLTDEESAALFEEEQASVVEVTEAETVPLTDEESAALFAEEEASAVESTEAENVDAATDDALQEPPDAEVEFAELAEPVDPDADPELLGGPDEEVDPFTELAEPVDPDADPELLGGPDEEVDLNAPLEEPPDVDAEESPELLGGPGEEEPGEPELLGGPEDVDTNEDEGLKTPDGEEEAGGAADTGLREPTDADAEQGAQEAAVREKAKQQATFQARYKQPGNQDWRVRLSLSPNANYLYNAGTPRGAGAGILAPLAKTDGVIFPYTPTISTTYSANYEQYDLVHSNYRGVFYKNSRVGDINIRGTFTAQDTVEANYLLAVIHFFRSATKMFYGQDAERGTPPPVCLLNGLGQYQFSDHPVVISSFNYTTPNDVDYIRAVNPNNYGSNLLNRRAAVASNPGGASIAGLNRLLNARPNGLSKGALATTPAPSSVNQTVNNTAGATYVPTKIEIDITLIPVQTRSQVSKQFSLKGFANGDLLKGGFW